MSRFPLALILLAIVATAFPLPTPAAEVATYFSPRGGALAAIVSEIDHAESEILVGAYSLTSKPIAQALLDAAGRGVPVYVIVDRRQPNQTSSKATPLAIAGIPVKVDRAESLFHMKLLIIDRKTTIAGSYNFSDAAESRNAEILFVIRDPATARAAVENWQKHWAHSSPLKKIVAPDPPPTTQPAHTQPPEAERSNRRRLRLPLRRFCPHCQAT